jgi:hypothetical protein
MELLNRLVAQIQVMDHKQLQKYLFVALGVIVCCVVGLIYYLHQYNNDLLIRIKQLRTLSEKAAKIIEENKRMVKEEQRLKELLEANKEFKMQGFFEQFCRDQSITPEVGWDTRSEQVSEKFDEITLPATFKGQTTESLVIILDALEKKEIVYIKDLTIRTESPGKISFDIILATKKYKAFAE